MLELLRIKSFYQLYRHYIIASMRGCVLDETRLVDSQRCLWMAAVCSSMTVKDIRGIRVLKLTRIDGEVFSWIGQIWVCHLYGIQLMRIHTPYVQDAAYQYLIWKRRCQFSLLSLASSVQLFHLIWEGDTWSRDLVLEGQQGLRGMVVDWHSIELFAVPQARRLLVYAATLALWHILQSLYLFLVATTLCFSHFSGLLTRDDR